MSNQEPITVGYWAIRGLAAPLRMMVMYSGAPLDNVMYDCKNVDGKWDFSAWQDVKPAMKEKKAIINLPYVKAGDQLVTQSNACFAFLGRKFGLWGLNESDCIECEEYLCEVMDVRNSVVSFSYKGKEVCTDSANGFIENMCKTNSSLSKLELVLSRKPLNDTHFLVSNYPTAPDFHLYEMISQLKLVCATYSIEDIFVTKMPSLEHFYTNFRSLPGNQKYLNSGLEDKVPCNNKPAGFGSSAGGRTYVIGEDYDYDKLVGVM